LHDACITLPANLAHQKRREVFNSTCTIRHQMLKKIGEWLLSHLSFEALRWLVGAVMASGVLAALLGLQSKYWAYVQLAPLALIAVLYYVSRKGHAPSNKTFSWPLVLMSFVPQVEPTATYKSKLWLEFRNDSSKSLEITALDWKCNGDGIQLQPPFEYRLKVETAQGEWRNKSWRKEEKDAWVRPGWTFQIWIGINQWYKESDLIQRHKELRVGTLILQAKAPTGIEDIEVQL